MATMAELASSDVCEYYVTSEVSIGVDTIKNNEVTVAMATRTVTHILLHTLLSNNV